METIIAKCGLNCTTCPAYQATVADSDEKRKETAHMWSKMFNASIDWKAINCLGCQQSDKEKLFGHCLVCGIRLCSLEKGFATCAACPDFGCDKIAEIWKHAPDAKASLEKLRG